MDRVECVRLDARTVKRIEVNNYNVRSMASTGIFAVKVDANRSDDVNLRGRRSLAPVPTIAMQKPNQRLDMPQNAKRPTYSSPTNRTFSE
jgi:hypothetical protein